MIAAAIPGRDEDSTTPRTISQRVEPSASAASSCSGGTLTKSSRQTPAMIGTAMIARITPATKIPLAPGCPPNNGMKPRVLWSHGSTWSARNGPSTRMPQSPRTTVGIAASISTNEPTTSRIPLGASSLRKSAIAMARGVAISRAMSEVTAVP